MSNIIIIGNGPAGISAALYTARAGLDTTVIAMGTGSLAKAHLIENYYGFAAPISGEELHNNGIEQAKRLGVKFVEGQVLGIGFESSLTVSTSQDIYSADSVIIATGSQRNTPNIPRIKDFEGQGVSYCAVCDGFFHRGKNVAVLGAGEYALHEAQELLPIAGSVTILTDGETPTVDIPETIKVDTRKIKELAGEQLLSSVIFDEGDALEISGLFVAKGVAGSADLARKLGAMTEGNKIVVNEEMATNIPGLFAAGDCTGGMLQVAKAVYQGAQAGSSAIKFVRSK